MQISLKKKQDLRFWTKMLATCVVVDASKDLDILTWVVSTMLKRCQVGNFSSVFHSLSTAAFASGFFIAWGIGKFVHHVVVTQRIEPFLLYVIFMIFFLSLSKRFHGNTWASTMHVSLIFECRIFAAKFPAPVVLDVTGHGFFFWQS